MNLEFSLQVIEKKSSNIKFHKNPSSKSRVAPGKETDGLTDITLLIVAFLNFAKAPKMG